MRRYILLITALISILPVAAQQLNGGYYNHPLIGAAEYYSANFGEMRPNHFHAGIDLKTDGVEGKAVVAVADGYISRISMSASGYGLALYVTHPNGTTSVYGHLSRFRKDIADFVFAERHRQKRNTIDITCKPDQFKVKRGEEIAKSGNTGSSFGPHLHFELREDATQKTLNTISQGIFKPKDNIAPLIMKLHYVEVDTLQGVPCHSRLETYSINRGEGSHYTIAQKKPLAVGRNGYFILETSDRKNDCANTYGVYNMVLKVDNQAIFEYRNDGFPFELSRYCNAVSHYPTQRNSRNEVMRAAMLQGGTNYFYPTLINQGAVSCKAEQKREVEFIATDDCGNSSTLKFDIIGKPDNEIFKAEIAPGAAIVKHDKDFALKVDERLSIVIARSSLYETIALEYEPSTIEIKADSTITVLSPAYTIHNDDTPLQKSFGLVFTQTVPAELRPYTAMAMVSKSGRLSYLGGRYRHNRHIARSSSFGTFCLVADTTPPTIHPQFEDGGDYRSRERISFRVTDNFSGVAIYDVFIDGEWVAIDYHRGRVSINLKAEGISGGKSHTIEIKARDNCGNITKWSGKIIR